MSLRDFNNVPFSDDPTALHTVPSGNGAGLESFHTTQPEDIEPNNMPKIVGAVAVALMIGVAGVALYAHSGNQPKPVVAASNLPPAPPAPQPAPAAMTPDATTPSAAEAPAPAAAMTPAEKTPAPVKSASIAKKHVASTETKSRESASSESGSAAATRLSADSSQSTTQPQQQQAVAEPASPQPSPSDVATNNTQSGVAVPSGANTA